MGWHDVFWNSSFSSSNSKFWGYEADVNADKCYANV